MTTFYLWRATGLRITGVIRGGVRVADYFLPMVGHVRPEMGMGAGGIGGGVETADCFLRAMCIFILIL